MTQYEELRMILETIENLGDTGASMFIWYLIADNIHGVMFITILGGGLLGGYKLIKKAMADAKEESKARYGY